MSSIPTSAINDPLRPRLLNASCMQVSPQSLAARFEPHAGDELCLTARVNRAQVAATAKVLSEIPTDSDDDEHDAPFAHLPAAMKPQLTEHLLKLRSPHQDRRLLNT